MIVYTSIITVRQEKLRVVFFVSKCISGRSLISQMNKEERPQKAEAEKRLSTRN
jgi:hypothetical protein